MLVLIKFLSYFFFHQKICHKIYKNIYKININLTLGIFLKMFF